MMVVPYGTWVLYLFTQRPITTPGTANSFLNVPSSRGIAEVLVSDDFLLRQSMSLTSSENFAEISSHPSYLVTSMYK